MFGEETKRNFCGFSKKATLALIANFLIPFLFLMGILMAMAIGAALVANYLPSLASFALAIIIGLVVFFALVFAAIAIAANIYLKSFRFSLEQDCFFVRRGIVVYSYTLIPYENMQDVHVSQSVTDWVFGTWNVSVFTATATGRGVETIPAMAKDDADRLRNAIFERIRSSKHVTD